MIRPGRTQDLRILRRTREGLVLGDDDPIEVVLPLNEAPREGSEEGYLRVYVDPGADGKLIATTRFPKIEAGTFAKLRVVAIRGAGAHVDRGMESPLLIPHEDQKKPMEEGRLYVMGAYYDKEAKRLFTVGEGDVPVLAGCCASFQCRPFARHPGGDHVVFIGEVLAFERDATKRPLLFQGGAYRRLAD